MIFFSIELKWSIRELKESQDEPKEAEKFLPHFRSQNRMIFLLLNFG